MNDRAALKLSIAFARSRWASACDKAFQENKRTGTVSEKTMKEVEDAEHFHNQLKALEIEKT